MKRFLLFLSLSVINLVQADTHFYNLLKETAQTLNQEGQEEQRAEIYKFLRKQFRELKAANQLDETMLLDADGKILPGLIDLEVIGEAEERLLGDCPICLEPNLSETPIDACGEGHYFHTECLKTSYEKGNHTCPSCRRDLTSKALEKIIPPNQNLLDAVKKNNLPQVEEALAKGADINTKDRFGNTALMLAARNDYLDIVKLLINKETNLTAKNNDGNTALMMAVRRGYLGIVNLLIDKGADINAKDNDGETALMYAVEMSNLDMGNLDMVNLLIDKGADIFVKNKDGDTALILAASWGNLGIVNLLIDKGANLHDNNNNGYTALRLSENYPAIREALIAAGAQY